MAPTQVEDDALVFAYPALLGWVFALGSLLFLWFAVLPLVGAVRNMSPACQLVFAAGTAACAYGWWQHTRKVVLDPRGITLTGPGRSRRIEYCEITKVEHRLLPHALVIRAGRKNIQIQKALEAYPAFYEVLSSRLPPLLDRPPRSFPLRVRTRWWVWALGGLWASGGLILAGLALSHFLHGETEGALGPAIMGLLLLPMGLYGLLRTPREYVLDTSLVEAFHLLSYKAFRVSELRDLRLERDQSPLEDYLLVRLVFDQGEIQVREVQVDYPVQDLFELLSAGYLNPEWAAAEWEPGGPPVDEVEIQSVGKGRRQIGVTVSRRQKVAMVIAIIAFTALPELARVGLQSWREIPPEEPERPVCTATATPQATVTLTPTVVGQTD